MPNALKVLEDAITRCTRCPRLVEYRERVAREKRRMYRDQEYWGRPVPGFGDPTARILILGLAPAAHGANRTGRMFTGDRSGDFLYRTLHEVGLASQPESLSRSDGLRLRDVFISASCRCAPPANKPAPGEIRNCRWWLEQELALLKHVRVVVALGRIAFDDYLTLLRDEGHVGRRSAFAFAHNRVHNPGLVLPALISSYHPSQQNTQTGKLTYSMFREVFVEAMRLADARNSL
ncbi:MAG TPA: uracil-DNA glycosylase [Bryobacteraceae bacterium]|nr:uracil-DNA glycosylase [Bryobacteraceae bacterium]